MGNPAQDHFVVFGEIASTISAEGFDESAAKHQSRVGDGQVDEAIERNLVGGEALVRPVHVMGVAASGGGVASKVRQAGDGAQFGVQGECLDLSLKSERTRDVIGIHSSDQVATGDT